MLNIAAQYLLDHGVATELDADRGAAGCGLERAAGAGAGDDLGRRAHTGFDVVVPAAVGGVAAGRTRHVEDEVLLVAIAERDVDFVLIVQRAAARRFGDLILASEARAADAIERGLELRGHVFRRIDDEGFVGAALLRDRIEAGLRAASDVVLTEHADRERADAGVRVHAVAGEPGDVDDHVWRALRGNAVRSEHGDHAMILVCVRPRAGL